MVLIFWPPINLVPCNWHMMQMFCVCLRYDGLGSSHLTLRSIVFRTAVNYNCHLKIGGSLKEFSPDVTCTRKPQNGGKGTGSCISYYAHPNNFMAMMWVARILQVHLELNRSFHNIFLTKWQMQQLNSVM
uniref:Uncharacterized protein n=2 Tax=Aegilops tauschii subsp. strangulata TaxID=200361 RepID=A0A453LU62_AEGTS